MEFKEKLAAYVQEIEQALDKLPAAATARPKRIHEAMRYSLSAGGKRIRPALLLASRDLFESGISAIPAAVSVECLHTYSLIHDDLPAMDDSPLRRGVPTCHIQFDEATAVLAGDALLTLSFELLSTHYAETPEVGLRLVQALSETAGSRKLIGGQMEDILGEDRHLDADELNFIHLNKTSALIEASLEMGATIGNASDSQIEQLLEYGRCIGLGFQIMDDILDSTSDSKTMGKEVGADEAANKSTYVSIHGLEYSRRTLNELTDRAYQICDSLKAPFLKDFARYLNERTF